MDVLLNIQIYEYYYIQMENFYNKQAFSKQLKHSEKFPIIDNK